METLNHHSFLVFSLFLLAGSAVLLWRLQQFARIVQIIIWLGVAVILAGLWFMLRPSPVSTVTSLNEAEDLIGNGRPTVIEFYSIY